jgi:hypothetical protein
MLFHSTPSFEASGPHSQAPLKRAPLVQKKEKNQINYQPSNFKKKEVNSSIADRLNKEVANYHDSMFRVVHS